MSDELTHESPEHLFLVGQIPLSQIRPETQAELKQQLLGMNAGEIRSNIGLLQPNVMDTASLSATQFRMPLSQVYPDMASIIPDADSWTRLAAWVNTQPGHSGQILGLGEIQDQPQTVKDAVKRHAADRIELISAHHQIVAIKSDQPADSAFGLVIEESANQSNIQISAKNHLSPVSVVIKP